MATYKLTYFNFRGRAEISRLLLNLAGKKFEDHRIPLNEWKELKTKTPFQKLPILEVNEPGKKLILAQSITIARYLANKVDFSGKNEAEKAQCDMIVDQITDLQNMITKIYMEKVDDELNKALDQAAIYFIPENLGFIQTILKDNRYQSRFLVGENMTWADLSLMLFYDILRENKSKILNGLPYLKEHDEMMRNIPEISEHLKNNAHVRVSIKW